MPKRSVSTHVNDSHRFFVVPFQQLVALSAQLFVPEMLSWRDRSFNRSLHLMTSRVSHPAPSLPVDGLDTQSAYPSPPIVLALSATNSGNAKQDDGLQAASAVPRCVWRCCSGWRCCTTGCLLTPGWLSLACQTNSGRNQQSGGGRDDGGGRGARVLSCRGGGGQNAALWGPLGVGRTTWPRHDPDSGRWGEFLSLLPPLMSFLPQSVPLSPLMLLSRLSFLPDLTSELTGAGGRAAAGDGGSCARQVQQGRWRGGDLWGAVEKEVTSAADPVRGSDWAEDRQNRPKARATFILILKHETEGAKHVSVTLHLHKSQQST